MRTTTAMAPILAVLLAAGVARGEAAPVPPDAQAEAPLAWGAPSAGLATAIELQGEATVGGKFVVRLALKSAAGQRIGLPSAKDAFGWLLVVQQLGEARKAFYSAKIPMGAGGAAWPTEIGGDAVVRLGPFDLSAATVYPARAARPLLETYLSGQDDVDLPAPAGKLAELLSAGPAMAKFTLCLRREGERPSLITSGTLKAMVNPPDVAAMAGGARDAFLKDLLKQFNLNPWAGMQAHDTCVRLGKDVVPQVLEAAFETDRPSHARLWLATTVADIRDPRCVDALVKLLDDPSDGVRYVVAYHGVKQNAGKLDQALIAKVKSAQGESRLAAWALLGFMVHRNTVPDEVLKAGLESDDPRARATVAEALAQHASDFNVERLAGLLQDKNEQVRGVAAKMLGQSRRPTPGVLAALVRALNLPGDSARQRIAKALSDLTGNEVLYDPKADAAAREKAIAAWKTWWSQRQPGR